MELGQLRNRIKNPNVIMTLLKLAELADLIEADLFQAGNALYCKKWDIETKIQSLPQDETLNLINLWK